MRKILSISSAFLILSGCSEFNEAHIKDVVELAVQSNEFLIHESGGSVPIMVYSNGKVNAEMLGGTPDWADINRTNINGDGSFVVYVNPNDAQKRMLNLRLTLEGKENYVDVAIKQEGFDQTISCESPYETVSGKDAGSVNFSFKTNVSDSLLKCNVEYLGLYKGWVSGTQASNGRLSVSFANNPYDISRRAKVHLYFIDGWNEEKSIDLFITQSNSEGKVGSDISFARVKSYASLLGNKIEDDWILEGVVVSDKSSANMELNPMLSSSKTDTTASRKVAYIEGLDGSWGLKAVFDKVEENQLKFGMKVRIDLYQTSAYWELDPDRYTITGLSGWNIIKSEADCPVPEKIKSISEIDDNDIYTFVSLKNTEFAFKKGSYADVLETNATGSATGSASALDGWASLLVDDEGNGIYAPVNMMCPWRRTGGGVPQGAGNTKGIIVHNEMSRLGDAGRYQIRVLDEKGFGMSDDSDLTEYAYIINSYSNTSAYAAIDSKYKYNKLATVIPSNDVLVQTPARMEMVSENTVVPDSRQTDPYTTAKYYNAKDKGTAGDGVSTAWVGIGDITTARDWYKWSAQGELVGYNGFVFSVNTEDLSSAKYAEFAFDFAGGYTSTATGRSWPAHWCLECSVDDGATWTLIRNSVNGKDYVHMRGLPWSETYYNGQWYQTPMQAGMGFSQHSFRLPQEALGQTSLKLRLRPYDTVIVSLPLYWQDDIEQSKIDYSNNVDIRVRFGFIYFRYR